MCCTFNMKAADKIFKGNLYADLVQGLQKGDRAGAFGDTSLPTAYNGEPISR